MTYYLTWVSKKMKNKKKKDLYGLDYEDKSSKKFQLSKNFFTWHPLESRDSHRRSILIGYVAKLQQNYGKIITFYTRRIKNKHL